MVLVHLDGTDDHILARVKRGLETPQMTQDARDEYRITWNVYATYETYICHS